MSLTFIDIKDLSITTPDYPRNVSLAVSDKDNSIHLLGNLPHNTKLGINRENAVKLINLLTKGLKNEKM